MFRTLQAIGIKLLFLTFISAISLTGCSINGRPSKKDAEDYLKDYLYEPYQITAETHDNEQDIYDIYLPDNDITVHLTCKYESISAWDQEWCFYIDDYFEKKFILQTDEREKIRKEKYPTVHEQINFRDDLGDFKSIGTVDISIDSEDDFRDLYNYLVECYKLNDFKYYQSYSSYKNQITSLYWQDFISIKLFCSDEQIMHLNFSELRQQEHCLPKELEDMITYEEFERKKW